MQFLDKQNPSFFPDFVVVFEAAVVLPALHVDKVVQVDVDAVRNSIILNALDFLFDVFALSLLLAHVTQLELVSDG